MIGIATTYGKRVEKDRCRFGKSNAMLPLVDSRL
jgi:hypothetical protein